MSCGNDIIFLLQNYPKWNTKPLMSAMEMASKGDILSLKGLKCILEPNIEWQRVANVAARTGHSNIIEWIGSFYTLNIQVIAAQAKSTGQWNIYEQYSGFWELIDPADQEEKDDEQIYKEDFLPEENMPKLEDPYLGSFLPEEYDEEVSGTYQNEMLDEYEYDERNIGETGFTILEYESEYPLDI